MNTYPKITILFLLSLALVFSCGEKEPEMMISSDKKITQFRLAGTAGTIDETAKNITVALPFGTDNTSLAPTISISAKAVVNPATGIAQDFSGPVVYTVTAEDESSTSYTVTTTIRPLDFYAFTMNGKNYELIKENRNWEAAAAFAVQRNGYLAEINDFNEQSGLFSELINNGAITSENTTAPDGGGASYIWLGGNDMATEGNWIWDGNNDATGIQFWMGDASGSPVDGLYNNWGDEPDNSGGQDGLGLSITDWPFGTRGQWNDVDAGNDLYFVIEYD